MRSPRKGVDVRRRRRGIVGERGKEKGRWV